MLLPLTKYPNYIPNYHNIFSNHSSSYTHLNESLLYFLRSKQASKSVYYLEMEDLVHGLINVALNRNESKQDNDEDYSISNLSEVHSRSTWAEVVSKGKDEEEEENEYEKTNSYSTRLGTRKEENKGRNDDNWETVGNDKKQQQSYRRQQNEESDEIRNDEGWETVEQKKQHHSSGKQHKVQVDNWQSYKRPPSEQEYKYNVQQDADTDPTRDELYDLAKACNKLWELDSNRLTPGKDYEIDCGEGKKVYQQQDMASNCLFSWVANDVFNRATYGRFCCLLDNYNPNQGSKEVVTAQEKHEQVAFIEEISRTAPIRYLHKYLCKKGIVSESNEEFKKMMMSLWFDLHGRGGGHSCSSAFEHVFVGEIKNRGENEVSGFHNWIQFYLEEAKGHVDYQGYIFPRRRGERPDSETQLLTVQFEWNGVLKSLSSTFVGVSPEFEIALYTLCYFVGGEDNHIYVGPYDVNIKCYRLGEDKIGSIFPIAES